MQRTTTTTDEGLMTAAQLSLPSDRAGGVQRRAAPPDVARDGRIAAALWAARAGAKTQAVREACLAAGEGLAHMESQRKHRAAVARAAQRRGASA